MLLFSAFLTLLAGLTSATVVIRADCSCFGLKAAHFSFTLFTIVVILVVIGLNVRRNQPQSSNVGLNVRSIHEPLACTAPGAEDTRQRYGNLSCVFSTEKYSVIRK